MVTNASLQRKRTISSMSSRLRGQQWQCMHSTYEEGQHIPTACTEYRGLSESLVPPSALTALIRSSPDSSSSRRGLTADRRSCSIPHYSHQLNEEIDISLDIYFMPVNAAHHLCRILSAACLQTSCHCVLKSNFTNGGG